MAFSFHIGTKWCHDFPKLAKESGFCFNAHRSGGHVDWNHISSVNIDRVIKERDFITVDANIGGIINYNLESKYDIKILDSNFVKVFRLAQLAVEYLLYCKQYLDQSVIILKDELKLKIEDNHKLRKEITALEEIIKNLKDKAKERNRIVEAKIGDSNGEIHKCPHCPKSFISAMFVKAHVARRHRYIADLSVETSPVHDRYKAETEKLHREIKMLKERLNQAEKIIRNESDKIDNKNKESNSENANIQSSVNKFELIEKQQIKNNKEINDLKSLLLAELYNLRHRDESSNKVNDNVSEINVKLLISQQEKEIERLRNQLLEKLTPDIEKMHDKLKTQEDYWRCKIQDMDRQNHTNMEKITSELKLTQQAAELVKTEYELKVSALEKQCMDQSNILTKQSKQLSSLSCDIKHSRYLNDKNIENRCTSTTNSVNRHSKNAQFESTKIAEKSKIESILVAPKILQNDYEGKDTSRMKDENHINHKAKILQKHSKNDSFEIHSDVDSLRSISNGKDEYTGLNAKNSKINMENHKEAKHLFTAESTSSVTSTMTESETESDPEIKERNTVPLKKNQAIFPLSKSTKTSQNNIVFFENVRKDVIEKFQKKLRDIGIDPEWNEIPQVSYKQKIQIIQHHQSINSKKFFKYNEIRRNIIQEILHRISRKNNILQQSKSMKKSPLDKLVTNVKSKAMKAFNVPKSSCVPQQRRFQMNSAEKSDVNEHDSTNEKETQDMQETSPRMKKFMNEKKFYKTSTPKQDDSISLVKSQEVTESLLISPKHSKGALKSAAVPVSSIAKKKVFFYLEAKKDKEISSSSQQTELNDSDWNISSISDEKEEEEEEEEEEEVEKRRSYGVDNIVLKTTQAEKIAEISKKIEEQLIVSRKKPIGAVETLFPLAYTPENNDKGDNKDNKNTQPIHLSSLSISNSSTEELSRKLAEDSKNNGKKFSLPMPMPRNMQKKEFNSPEKAIPIINDSKLDADIDAILQVE